MPYTIVREIGKGGMGAVYEATDDNTGTHIALKMMSAKAAAYPDYREMFDQEVQSLRKLSHPCIVNIVGEPYQDTSGNLFLPMEYIEGKTISQIVQDPAHGPYSEDAALSIFTQLLDVFNYIHSHGCIHRDIKPSNIMIRPTGSVCVIDFGIAKDSRTRTGKTIGRIVGTDGYMSPEQANGLNIDKRTDIYSLGCLLHYMLSGSHAINKHSNDYETICAILDNNFPLVSEKGISISARTQNAILRAVNKDMRLRFQSANEFKGALLSEQLSANRYVITVGRSGCDINISGEYISKNHLEILFEFNTGTNHVTITDHSTNGTGVNGRLVRGSSYEFTYATGDAMRNDNNTFPTVMLSGLPEYTLDWKQIANVLFDKTGRPTSVLPKQTNGAITTIPPTPQHTVTEDISVGYGILSFIVPVVGWVLSGIWKKDSPTKAQKANKLAWLGLLFNISITIISSIIAT
ncbi:MAG: protein kinase [Bacteroidales bacterium]|nr:protein kinase [Bacteroidales bacterium]